VQVCLIIPSVGPALLDLYRGVVTIDLILEKGIFDLKELFALCSSSDNDGSAFMW
jgi:hypothetical protein